MESWPSQAGRGCICLGIMVYLESRGIPCRAKEKKKKTPNSTGKVKLERGYSDVINEKTMKKVEVWTASDRTWTVFCYHVPNKFDWPYQ